MATAVLDLDFWQLPSTIKGLDRYTRALILIRMRGRPVGKVVLPVVNGSIHSTFLCNALMDAAGWRLWETWLHDYLGWDEACSVNFKPQPATVAICTRDRSEELRDCLKALHRMINDGHEILVIDNCSATDSTRCVVESFRGVRYVREDIPGLNAARNRALREARHEIVAFTDDDASPDPGWLRSLLRNFNDPLVLCVTGLTMPLELETEAQEWFEHYCPFGRGFRRNVYDNANLNPISAGRAGAGANMALRRRVLDCVGSFDESLDAGTSTHSGGDTEMFSRILAAGYRIVYDPAALSWHRHRRTWDELQQTIYGYGVGVYAFWTRSLLIEREWTVLKAALIWFLFYQLRNIARSLLKRPNSMPLKLLLVELKGCALGPWAYLSSSKRLRSRSKRL